MITLEKLKIYKKCAKDDYGIKYMSKRESRILNENDLALLDNYMHKLFLINKGLAADSFIKDTLENLRICCDTKDTFIAIKEFSKKID